MQRLDDEQRDEGVAHAHGGPAVGEVGRQRGAVGALPESRAQGWCDRAGRRPPARVLRARDARRKPIIATLPATTSVQAYTKKGARIDHAASGPPIAGPEMPPSRKPPWKSPTERPRCVGRDDTQQQAHRADREHRRADAAGTAQQQQLQVAVREPGERAADRDDADAGREHDAFTDRVDERPTPSADASRMNANADSTAPTSALPTPK